MNGAAIHAVLHLPHILPAGGAGNPACRRLSGGVLAAQQSGIAATNRRPEALPGGILPRLASLHRRAATPPERRPQRGPQAESLPHQPARIHGR